MYGTKIMHPTDNYLHSVNIKPEEREFAHIYLMKGFIQDLKKKPNY